MVSSLEKRRQNSLGYAEASKETRDWRAGDERKINENITLFIEGNANYWYVGKNPDW